MKDPNFFAELRRRNVYKLVVSFVSCGKASPFLEIARVLVRPDYVACRIVKRESEHRGDRKRFVVRADEKLTAFVELEAAIQSRT